MYRVSRLSARRHREGGAAMVEMVFVLVPMLALLFLMLDTAWMIFAKASLQEAVREATRFGVVGQLAPGCSGLNASIRQIVQQHSAGFVTAQNASSVVSITYTSPTDSTTPLSGCGATSGGNILLVTVSGVSLVPMAPLLRSSSPFILGASSADAMEPTPNNCP